MNSTKPGADRLRLLIVGTYPPPYGGIATHLTTLMPGLKQRGTADVAVVSFSDRDAVDKHDGFVVYRFNVKNHLRRLSNPRNWPLALRTMAPLMAERFPLGWQAREAVKSILVEEIARKHRSNVVSFYQCDMSLQLPGLAAHWKGRRAIVMTVFGEIYEANSQRMIREHADFFRRMFDLPAAIASSSRHCATGYREIGVKRTIEPVYYGVDLNGTDGQQRGAAWRERAGIAADEIVVLYMARFSTEMGLDVVMKAAEDILAGDPKLRLVLAGAAGDQSEPAEALARAHPDRIIIKQNVPFAEQADLYSAADMLVAPSFNQRACMGMAIKEAMAARLPVIAGAGGGVPEAVVDNETGYLIPLDESGAVDARLFASSVLQLAKDAETRKRLGDAGRRRAESMFAYDRTNQRMTEIFLASVPTEK